MKKIISIVLAAIMLVGTFTFVSCGNDASDTLVVAMSPDFAPLEFYDTSKSGSDAIVGFDVLLSNFIAKELGKKLVIKPMDFYACMSAVQTGSADLGISGFAWTADRAENFLISDYYVAGEGNNTDQIVITLAGNTYTKAEDFNGKKVGAQGGSLQQLLVTEQLVSAGAEIVKFDSTSDALTALKGGQIDAFAVAKVNGDAFIAQNDGVVDYSGFKFEIDEKYKNNVILLNKSQQSLLEEVNKALAKAMAANLYDAWLNACKTYSDITTIDENGYDENGNKILGWDENKNPIIDGSIAQGTASTDDLEKKAAYESFLKQYQ